MSAKRQGHSHEKTFFSLPSLKRPRPYCTTILSTLFSVTHPSLYGHPGLSALELNIQSDRRHTTLSNCYKKQIGTQLFHRANHTFHRHMQSKNTAPVAKTILLSLHVPKFSHFPAFHEMHLFVQHIPGLLSQKHRGVCEGLMGICQSCTKDN